MLGAEEYGFCTAILIVLGCVMLRHCNLNNCSVGIATQDDILRAHFSGKVDHIINYFTFVANELREVMASLGVKKIDDLIGRTELLEVNTEILPWKAKNIDFSKILYKPEVPSSVDTRCTRAQDHNIEKVLDRKLIEMARPALENAAQVKLDLFINNTNRTTGAMLSGAVCKRFGESGLPEDTIHCKFNGVAGQSYGAFLAKGVTFELEGMANDYVGKGISGGKIIIYPDKNTEYKAEENILIGNTTFYGAIAGEAYIRGLAGERFCIRNSGLNAVVEGVGDHGCEYMTGGHVVILGKTGRNFGAGMSGGIAYVYDVDGHFKSRCNMEMIDFDPINDEDLPIINNLIRNHMKYTHSALAKSIIDDLKAKVKHFIKVMPKEYKRVLDETKAMKNLEVSDG
jgi:glutamate synthase (NADPH) large chain